ASGNGPVSSNRISAAGPIPSFPCTPSASVKPASNRGTPSIRRVPPRQKHDCGSTRLRGKESKQAVTPKRRPPSPNPSPHLLLTSLPVLWVPFASYVSDTFATRLF